MLSRGAGPVCSEEKWDGEDGITRGAGSFPAKPPAAQSLIRAPPPRSLLGGEAAEVGAVG